MCGVTRTTFENFIENTGLITSINNIKYELVPTISNRHSSIVLQY